MIYAALMSLLGMFLSCVVEKSWQSWLNALRQSGCGQKHTISLPLRRLDIRDDFNFSATHVLLLAVALEKKPDEREVSKIIDVIISSNGMS